MRPDAIIFEPVGGTALPQVAKAAVNAGIGWVILNRDAIYIEELRKTSSAPIFAISSDHVEIGRIQGRQMAALLRAVVPSCISRDLPRIRPPRNVLRECWKRSPASIQVTMLKAQWTQESAQRSVRSWLKLTTSQRAAIDLVSAQDDSMAMGARDAFKELTNEDERERWLKLPFTGCDGLPKTGQAWVRSGLLAATVFVPPNTGQAIEMLVDAIQNRKMPAERSYHGRSFLSPLWMRWAAKKPKRRLFQPSAPRSSRGGPGIVYAELLRACTSWSSSSCSHFLGCLPFRPSSLIVEFLRFVTAKTIL